MVDLDEEAFDAPPRPSPAGRRRHRQQRPGPGRSSARRKPRRTVPSVGSDIGPFLLLLASIAPLAGALYRIIDLVGLDGLTATRVVGPRLQLLGNAVNPLTGLLVLGAVVVAVMAPSSHVRTVAGTAFVIATLLLAVAVAVAVAAVRDARIFTRVNDAHVEVISYEVGSALVALAVMWLALRVLRRPPAA